MGLFRRKKPVETPGSPEPEPAPAPALAARPTPTVDGLRAVDDHRDWVLSHIDRLPAFGQTLLDAVGLSVCEDIVADLDLPRFDQAAADGYAVRSADLAGCDRSHPVKLPVAGSLTVGDPGDEPIRPGSAIRVAAGAPLPPGADAVVAYQDTDRGWTNATVLHGPAPGERVHRRGQDVAEGDRIVADGDLLGPRQVGMLAGIGIDQVLVRPRPRVVVVSAGSEFAAPGSEPAPGQVYDATSFLLAALARSSGAQVFRIGVAGDDADALAQTISDQLVRADLLITSGSAGGSERDLVRQVLARLGDADFARVAMQPGMAQGFALIGDERTPAFLVPGGPVPAYISFEIFVRPALRRMMGLDPGTGTATSAVSGLALTSRRGVTQYRPGRVSASADGRRHVVPTAGEGSHTLVDLARANALVVLGPGVGTVAAGDPVEVRMLDDEPDHE